jgi:choline dehydrogenase-like flavoprotein
MRHDPVGDRRCGRQQLKVHGTKNFSVFNASAYPIETLGNIQAIVYSVAENAAGLIKRN